MPTPRTRQVDGQSMVFAYIVLSPLFFVSVWVFFRFSPGATKAGLVLSRMSEEEMKDGKGHVCSRLFLGSGRGVSSGEGSRVHGGRGYRRNVQRYDL